MKRLYRLLKTQDFKKVLDKKHKVSRENYIFYFSFNNLDHCRVGVSVSSKLGNSVVRHRVKRQFVSMIDKILNFNLNYDIVVIARKKYFNYSYQENMDALKKDFDKVLINNKEK